MLFRKGYCRELSDRVRLLLREISLLYRFPEIRDVVLVAEVQQLATEDMNSHFVNSNI